MNFQEIITELQNQEFSVEDFDNIDSQEIDGIGLCEEKEKEGGYEGSGEYYFSIKYFPSHDIYIKIEGAYYSHYGIEYHGWSGVTEVRPREKTVIIYE